MRYLAIPAAIVGITVLALVGLLAIGAIVSAILKGF